MSFFRILPALFLSAAIFMPAMRAVDLPAETAPLVSAAETPALPGGELRSFVAARRALELGFPSVAAELYTQLLGSLQTVGAERDVLVLELVTARLDEGRTDDADQAMQLHSGARTAAYQLRAGLIAMRRKRIDVAKTTVAAIKVEDLSAGDRGWWYFLQGQVADAAADFTKAREAYQRAADVAVSDLQRAHFALARERARLNLGDTSEAQLTSLRQGVERYQGKSVGYAYARQYAALLSARGRTDEAVQFLIDQLQILPSGERAARDDFRLLLGLTAGPQRAEGRNALEGLLTSAEDPALQRVALQLLATNVADTGFFAKLNALINASPAHPILADMLLVRAQLSLAEKRVPVVEKSGGQDSVTMTNQAQAELDAKTLLTRFPASELKPAALGVLADLSWELKRYRTAADYASQARAQPGSAGEVRAALGVMMAEAYFQAGDFKAADEAYAVALEEAPAGVSTGLLISQRVLAKIRDGQLDGAAKLLDGFAGDARLDTIQRWQSEWSLAQALQIAERGGEAYARVNLLMAGGAIGSNSLPAPLRARVAWLQAKLSLEAGEPRRTLELADALPASLNGLDAPLRGEVEASVRLLRAKAFFALGQATEALNVLNALRTDFPQADAAVYSYIDEADYYAAAGRFVDAQAQLIALADTFKQHAYAPYALYRAALTVEQRGQDQYYEEAYRILERIVTTKAYEQSPVLFYAYLKQGDLARRLNDFPRASVIYEFLVNNHAQHRDVVSAELALAACHRAQITASDVSHFESALTILERLQDLPSAPVDLRTEAGFQLGDLLATSGKSPDFRRAEGVWWTMVTTFLLDDAQAAKLGPKGRYWLARALLRLGDSRRDRGDLESARNAYELVLTKNLPFAKLAREAFARAGGKLPSRS